MEWWIWLVVGFALLVLEIATPVGRRHFECRNVRHVTSTIGQGSRVFRFAV